MKKKIPFLLIILFMVIVFGKIFTNYYFIFSNPSNSKKFNKAIGELSIYIKPYEANSLKTSFSWMMRKYSDAVKKTQLDSKAQNQDSENAQNDYEIPMFDKFAAYRLSAEKFNHKLNRLTQKYMLKSMEVQNNKSDEPQQDEKKYNYMPEVIGKDIKFDEKKLAAQQKQLGRLKKILSPEDFSKLSKSIDEMNAEKMYMDRGKIFEIYSILANYEDLPSEIIIGQLTGKYEVKAYFEFHKDEIVSEALEPVLEKKSDDLNSQKYEKLAKTANKLLKGIGDSYFKGYYIFSDPEKKLIAQASDFQSNKKGYLGINIDAFKDGVSTDFEKNRFSCAIVSKLSQVITQSNDQIDYTKGSLYSDNSIRDIAGISQSNSYILQFYNRFWDDVMLADSLIASMSDDSNAVKYFYLRHDDEFAGEYASLNPFTDIEYSMTAYFLNDRSLEVSVKADKIRFFYEFEELARLKKLISYNINHLEEQ